ncbi:MAG: sigma 54-interacting transcriptional regulator, partial [Deltaproteobacteria bacterium]|nr:sigma 54-interacting transcriptional regulator [Deltaproteobacteria bacterium]
PEPPPGPARPLLHRLRSQAKSGWIVPRAHLASSLSGKWLNQANALFDGIHADLILLLVFQGKILGFLAIGKKLSGLPFDRDDMELLRSVAPQASVALRNAIAYTHISRLNEQLQARQQEILSLHTKLRAENLYLREAAKRAALPEEVVAQSDRFKHLLTQIDTVAATDVTVLLLGETGTGKDLLARLIHERSPRAAAPLLSLNCAAIPENLLESELFGHVKGAFTGAVSDRPGTFVLADKGTLFLDEVGDMPPSIQSKLLRVLEEHRVTPVGGSSPKNVDVRILAATNRPLETMVEQGTFRQDLYYRLNVVPIAIPPLRQRTDDILPMAQYFLLRSTRKLGKRVDDFSADAKQRMLAYHWPGNVRELANVVERAVVLATGPIIDREVTLPSNQANTTAGAAGPNTATGAHASTGSLGIITGSTDPRLDSLFALPYAQATEEFKRLLIRQALAKTDGNKSRAAEHLDLQRTYLHRLMKKLGL